MISDAAAASITDNNIRGIQLLLEGDSLLTVIEIANGFGLSYGRTLSIFTGELWITKVWAR